MRGSDWKHDFNYIAMSWFDHVNPWLFKTAFPLIGDSKNWAALFPFQIDVLFLDGNHEYGYVMEELRLLWPKMRKGGVLLGHDYYKGRAGIGVKKAAHEFFGKPGEPGGVPNPAARTAPASGRTPAYGSRRAPPSRSAADP